MKIPNDYELDFLKSCTKEELAPLVGVILGTDDEGNIDCAGRFSSHLDMSPAFIKFYPDHTKYVDDIIEEVQKFGANSLATIMRGGLGVPYHEVLCDAAKKLKVNFNKKSTTKVIEECLLSKILMDAWERMSEDERKMVLKEAEKVFGVKVGGISAAAAIKIFRAGGFKSYQLAMIIVNAVAKSVFGHGLKLAGNVYLARLLAVLAGPVGWAISGVWTLADIASPAFRVTLPACVYIAALRKMKENEKFAGANNGD